MNVCIIGDGLTSLSLAKNLINKKINVHIYQKNKINNLSSNRTIGISKNNFEFFKKEVQDIPEKKISEVKLPRNPRIFIIFVLSGKIKLGSSGEKVINETSNKRPAIKIDTPRISMTLFMLKFIALLANFFNFIN